MCFKFKVSGESIQTSFKYKGTKDNRCRIKFLSLLTKGKYYYASFKFMYHNHSQKNSMVLA